MIVTLLLKTQTVSAIRSDAALLSVPNVDNCNQCIKTHRSSGPKLGVGEGAVVPTLGACDLNCGRNTLQDWNGDVAGDWAGLGHPGCTHGGCQGYAARLQHRKAQHGTASTVRDIAHYMLSASPNQEANTLHG